MLIFFWFPASVAFSAVWLFFDGTDFIKHFLLLVPSKRHYAFFDMIVFFLISCFFFTCSCSATSIWVEDRLVLLHHCSKSFVLIEPGWWSLETRWDTTICVFIFHLFITAVFFFLIFLKKEKDRTRTNLLQLTTWCPDSVCYDFSTEIYMYIFLIIRFWTKDWPIQRWLSGTIIVVSAVWLADRVALQT